MTVVKKAVVPLSIPSMLDVAPREANANNVNGNALLKMPMIKMPGKCDLKRSLYLRCNKRGIKTTPAIKSLKVTSNIGPKSTAEIFINIKALPHRAPKNISSTQYLNSISLK